MVDIENAFLFAKA
jgi:hypothetical protein